MIESAQKRYGIKKIQYNDEADAIAIATLVVDDLTKYGGKI